MGVHKFLIAFLYALVLARIELSVSTVLRGSVFCQDCDANYDLSGIRVRVKCRQVRKLAFAITLKDGTFETELPPGNPFKCRVKIHGGSTQLYAMRRDMFSNIMKASDTDDIYTINPALKFYTSCPLAKNDPKCSASEAGLGSSMTVDLPVPPEWGLAPTSYYAPFMPIIGIP